jgi:hypothetical protein
MFWLSGRIFLPDAEFSAFGGDSLKVVGNTALLSRLKHVPLPTFNQQKVPSQILSGIKAEHEKLPGSMNTGNIRLATSKAV